MDESKTRTKTKTRARDYDYGETSATTRRRTYVEAIAHRDFLAELGARLYFAERVGSPSTAVRLAEEVWKAACETAGVTG